MNVKKDKDYELFLNLVDSLPENEAVLRALICRSLTTTNGTKLIFTDLCTSLANLVFLLSEGKKEKIEKLKLAFIEEFDSNVDLFINDNGN